MANLVNAQNALQVVRTTAVQRGYYKKIFSQGASGYSQAANLTLSFRQLLQVAGVEMPVGVEVSLSTAQMVLAGGAFVNDVSTGAKLFQCVGDASNAIAAAAQILTALGVIDRTWADLAALGVNTALVISSYGANILADIGFVISLINVVGDLNKKFGGDEDVAKYVSLKALSNNVKKYVNDQVSYAATQANLFSSGRLNYFDFVGNVALNSPLVFKGYFPQLATYFPSWVTVTFVSRGNSEGLFSTKSEFSRFELRQMLITKKDIQDVLLWEYLFKPITQYFRQEFVVDRIISITALSHISMLLSTGTNGPATMGFDFDILGACKMLGLTPFYLGDDWLFKGFLKNEPTLDNWETFLPYKPITLKHAPKPPDTGIYINGKPLYTEKQKRQDAESKKLVTLQKELQRLDELGDIDGLLKIPEGAAILKEWAEIYFDPQYGENGTVVNMQLKVGAVDVSQTPWFLDDIKNKRTPYLNAKYKPYIKANYSIDISDYWKCLNVIKMMRSSEILRDRVDDQVLNIAQFGSIDDLLKDFQEVYNFTMVKNLNRLARTQVAQSLGIPAEKLASRQMSDGTLIFYRKEA